MNDRDMYGQNRIFKKKKNERKKEKIERRNERKEGKKGRRILAEPVGVQRIKERRNGRRGEMRTRPSLKI